MLGLGVGFYKLAGDSFLGGFSTPADLPGIAHWYQHNTGLEESDESFPEDGEQVTKWTDQIGTEHFIGESNLPTYTEASGTLNFGGSSKILTIASGTGSDITFDGDFAIYVRVKFASTPNSSDIFLKDTDTTNEFLRAQSATVIRAKLSSTSNNWTVGTMGTSAFHNIGIERTGDDVRVYLDGTESSTGAVTAGNTWSIDTLKGGQADEFSTLIIVKGQALSTGNRAELQTYLAAL